MKASPKAVFALAPAPVFVRRSAVVMASLAFGSFGLLGHAFASQDAGVSPDAGADGAQVGSCVEHVPSGSRRPEMRTTFPERGRIGFATTLSIVIEHGKGETVLPRGFEIQRDSEGEKALKQAGFVIPDQEGGFASRVVPSDVQPSSPERESTTVEITFVPLPPNPGRHLLALPSLPIAVSRASGEAMTLCTRPHRIVVEDPTAETPDARPKPNPPGEKQLEEWTALRRAVEWAGAGLVLGGILAYAIYKYLKRPKPLPPPPPPRDPGDVALEKLQAIRFEGLAGAGRFAEHVDRVNDALRGYLGARYGFDGAGRGAGALRVPGQQRVDGRAVVDAPARSLVLGRLDDTSLLEVVDLGARKSKLRLEHAAREEPRRNAAPDHVRRDGWETAQDGVSRGLLSPGEPFFIDRHGGRIPDVSALEKLIRLADTTGSKNRQANGIVGLSVTHAVTTTPVT